jgi:hypothetical protein
MTVWTSSATDAERIASCESPCQIRIVPGAYYITSDWDRGPSRTTSANAFVRVEPGSTWTLGRQHNRRGTARGMIAGGGAMLAAGAVIAIVGPFLVLIADLGNALSNPGSSSDDPMVPVVVGAVIAVGGIGLMAGGSAVRSADGGLQVTPTSAPTVRVSFAPTSGGGLATVGWRF